MWEDVAVGVPEDDVSQFQGFRFAWVFRTHDFAGACGEEETGNQ